MSAVAQSDSTVAFIRSTVRELTASPGENQLTTAYIDQTLNGFYLADFPYAIKIDQMRNVYTFYTQPYRTTYPLDVNDNQGVRSPVYVDGVQAFFYKDRQEFYNIWPRWPTKFNPINGNGVTQAYSFTVPGPFLPNNIMLGGTDTSGSAIAVVDDGNGNMLYQLPNPVTIIPAITATVGGLPIPGMHNANNGNPGLNKQTVIGSVNYVTGAFSINFAIVGVTPAIPTQNYPGMNLFISQYQTGRPYSLLFWNNYFEIRPVPRLVHKVEVETYLTPVQFMLTTDNPILNQWAQYLAYGVSVEILRRRQDVAGVANLMEGFKRQESLVLERQATEEIGQRNSNIFSGSTPSQGWNNGWMQGGYG